MILNFLNLLLIDFAILQYVFVTAIPILILMRFFMQNCRRDSRLVKFADQLPGPRTYPFFGSYAQFYYGEDSLKTTIDLVQKYGHVYKLWFGKYLVVGVSKIDDIENIFMSSKMLEKPEIFQPYHDIWGDGLFTAPLNIWKKNRKKFHEAFTNHRFDIYTAQINSITCNKINKMKILIDKQEFNAWNFFVYLSFEVITKTMFDVEVDCWDCELITKFHQNLTKAQQICFDRMCLPWFQIKFIDYLFHHKQLHDITGSILEFSKKIVNSRKYEANRISHCDDKSQPVEERTKSFGEIAHELLSEGYDEKIICDEIYTVVSGGTNTNASVISFFLIAIAIHQNIQDKLYNEIYEVFGDSDRDADREDVKQLSYLDQVLKESFRRFTIAPFILRKVQEDSKIGDLVFPAGTAILISISALHFNPEYYPNPMDFNPNNFSPEAIKKRHKLAFIPFSAAARNCIGQNFAMLEFKLILSSLLRNFSFHTKMTMDDIKLNMGSVICSTSNLDLSIKLRTRKPIYR